MILFSEIIKKYPSIALNFSTHDQINNRARGFRHLCTFEPYIIKPKNWDMKVISQYDTFISCNRRFCEKRGIIGKSRITLGNFAGNFESDLEVFRPYDEKIKGLCMMNKTYHTGREGDIVFLRKELLEKLPVEPYLVKHLYSHTRWGGSCYQGQCRPYDPWGISSIEKVNTYRFCVCFENTYHPLWSWGYMTERLFRCFRAKTVPIYIGCYNIEEYVPKELFIDFRDFYRDYNRLAEYLITFPKKKYIEMVEKAYRWNKTHRIGSPEDFEKILKDLEGGK